MRIVRLANFVAPHSGGLRTCLAELGAGYLAAGHVPVLVIPGERDSDRLTAQGRVITMHAPRVPFAGGYRVLWRKRRLARLLTGLRPDALEVSDRTTLRWTGAWAREHGVPAVMVSHESVTALLERLGRVGRAVADWLNRRTARSYRQVICTTAWAAAEFERIGAGNVVRVPLGVDLATFAPQASQGRDQILLVRGWAALLAGALPEPEMHNLARLGALAADVERVQLPAAMTLRPEVASVVVGINDTLRGDFDPERTGASVARTVAALRAAGAQVLTMRLPDPGQMFGLPGALARPLARRMRAVNAAVDEVARRHETVHLDAARDPATYERRYWSVDGLHPNERGHRLIACRFHALLAASGYPVGPGPDPEPSSPPPTRLAEAGWMATKGTAWLVRRSRDLVPALVGLAVREWLSGADEPEDGQGSAEREPLNLNVLSRLSGNLRLNGRLPSAPLKVGGRSSKRNGRTKPPPKAAPIWGQNP